MEKIKWDGITEIEKIKPALLGFITEEEKQQAKKTAYGDFAEIIRKKYRNRGTNSGGLFVDAFRDKIMVYAEKTTYFMTWNKAAKYIRQWLDKEEKIMEKQEIITQNQEIIITENYSRAVSLHRKICANAQAAQESLFEVCKGLKEMRDDKLYKELNYSEFNDYCKSELGMTDRTAYKYISIAENLSENLVKSTSLIGTEKLYLLAKLDEPERQEIIQNNDLESTSVKKLQEEIKKLKADSESQINSMKTRHNQEKTDFMREKNELNKKLENKQKEFASKHNEWLESCKENAALTGQLYDAETERDEAYEKIQSLEKQIQELENRPVEVAVKDNSEEIQKLKNQLEQERQKVKVREIPDNSELFEVYYQNCIDSIDKLFAFLRNKNLKSFNERLYELSEILNDNISMLDEY